METIGTKMLVLMHVEMQFAVMASRERILMKSVIKDLVME